MYNQASKKQEKESSYRVIDFSNASRSNFKSNKIESHGSSFLQIIPATIFIEFQKVSYSVFLFIIILQLSRYTNELSLNWSSLFPFSILILDSLIQNTLKAINLKKLDKQRNSLEAQVLKENNFEWIPLQEVQVGDLVIISKEESVCADILILATDSGEDSCFIDTQEILGGKDLTKKKVVKEVQNFISQEGQDLINLLNHIENIKVTQPSPSFQHFSGKIKMLGNPKAIKLSIENLLLRESKIVSNQWVVGIVLYAGVETKVWINGLKKSLVQVSEFHRKLNNIMIINIILMIFYIFTSFGLGYAYENNYRDLWYYEFINQFYLYYTFVPVSIYFYLRVIKDISRFYINWRDDKIFIENFKLFENIGKVEYVLAGKSGILTEDELKVQVCVLKNRIWVDGEVCLMHGIQSFRSAENISSKDEESESGLNSFYELNEYIEGAFKEMDELKLLDFNDHELFYYVLCMMICNHYNLNKELSFISQEEKVIFEFGEKLGFKMKHRSINSAILAHSNFEFKFDILGSCGLYSEQKLNKIVIQNRETNEVLLLVKGKVETLIDNFNSPDDVTILEDTLKLSICQILQNIICGYRILTEAEANRFKFDYKTAKLSPVNIEGRISNIFCKLEAGLNYLGLIGIENPIKSGVKQTIKTLTSAGIKTWVVTGDSEESVLLTGSAIGLYDQSSNIVQLTSLHSSSECLQVLRTAENREIFKTQTRFTQIQASSSGSTALTNHKMNLDAIKKKVTRHTNKKTSKHKNNQILHSLSNISEDCSHKITNTSSVNFIISVDSNTFDLILTSAVLRKKFIGLLCAAKSSFFHSMTPDQKSKLVKFIKNSFSFRPTVLAVACEGTHSGMINEADIGVMIERKDGDIGYLDSGKISDFSVLTKLIVDIGLWTDLRLSVVILMSLYKSSLLNTVLFLFQINSQFTSFNLISYDLVVLFDLFMTSVPLVLLGLFYKQAVTDNEKILIYCRGFMGENLRYRNIVFSLIEGTIHGTLVYFFVVYTTPGCSLDIVGLLGYICVSLGFLTKVIMINFSLVYLNFAIILFYFAAFAVVLPLVLQHKVSDYLIESDEISAQLYFWLVAVFTPFILAVASIVLDYAFDAFRRKRPKTRFEQFEGDLGACFRDVDEWRKLENADDIDERFLHLSFKSPFREEEYQKAVVGHVRKIFKVFTGIGLVIVWIIFILRYTIDDGVFVSTSISVVSPIIITVQFGLMFYKNLNWEYFLFLSNLNLTLFTLLLMSEGVSSTSFHYRIYTYFFSVAANLRLRTTILQTVLTFTVSLILLFIETSQAPANSSSSYIQDCIFSSIPIFLTSLLCLSITYTTDINKRKQFITLKQTRSECKKAKNILSYLLPQFVRKRVKEGVRYIAEDKGTVSIIFVDLCAFDDIMQMYTPQELTSFLDDIFGRIDNLCESIGVTKIETVGKTYLACTGLKDSEEKMDPKLTSVPHARRAIEFALAIIREAEKIPLKDGNFVMFKIGINSGPVTAGVVGHHKPQFSLVGDAVNTASRMSSTLTESNAVQISMSTYGMIGNKNGLQFEDCVREVKGKGKMDTKIVTMPKEISSGFLDRNSSMHSFGINSSFAGMNSFHMSLDRMDSNQPRFIDREENETIERNTSKKFVNSILGFSFRENTVEFEFRGKYLDENFKVQHFGFVLNLLCNALAIAVLVSLVASEGKDGYKAQLGFLVLDELFAVVLFGFLKKYFKSLRFGYLAQVVFSMDFFYFFFYSFFWNEPRVLYEELLFFRFLIVNHCSGLFFRRSLFLNSINFSLWMVIISFNDPEPFHYIVTTFFCVLVIYCRYSSEYNIRDVSISMQAATRETEKTEELLTNMLPQNALKNLREENFATDRLSHVTFMYADIVGFTAWSSTKTPKEVVGKLSQLFTLFDKLCLQHNVYKVHTIGDCYVVMGYQSDRNRIPAREAENVLLFARELIQVIEDNNRAYGSSLSMRVGIHTGEVIGGITGTNIVRYDIYGADVLIANKMESNGEAGKVVVSEATKEYLEDYVPGKYLFDIYKEIHISDLNKDIKIFDVKVNESFKDV